MPFDELPVAALVEAAKQAARHAYVPASGFGVGAAVLTDDGSVFAGCNVENSSYGLTVCAERNAVFQAVAAGHRRIRAVVVHTDTDPPAAPCGACRQVLAEFGPDMTVLMVGKRGQTVETDLGRLLPLPFRFHGEARGR